jgi:hypothetical protein
VTTDACSRAKVGRALVSVVAVLHCVIAATHRFTSVRRASVAIVTVACSVGAHIRRRVARIKRADIEIVACIESPGDRYRSDSTAFRFSCHVGASPRSTWQVLRALPRRICANRRVSCRIVRAGVICARIVVVADIRRKRAASRRGA